MGNGKRRIRENGKKEERGKWKWKKEERGKWKWKSGKGYN